MLEQYLFQKSGFWKDKHIVRQPDTTENIYAQILNYLEDMNSVCSDKRESREHWNLEEHYSISGKIRKKHEIEPKHDFLHFEESKQGVN